MGTLTLDDGRSFTVDDSFGKLSPDKQQQIVGELKQQLSSRVAQDIKDAPGTIQVETPDGGIAYFPAGTSKDTVRSALRAKFGGGPAKNVAQEMSGTAPVKSGFSRMIENIPGSAANLVRGTAETAIAAAGAFPGQGPGDYKAAANRIKFVKDLAVGTWEGLKQRYGKGLGEALESDPVGVIADVLSLASGVRGGIRAGVRSEAAATPTPAAQRASAELTGKFIADQTRPADFAAAAQTRPGAATPMDVGGSSVQGAVERLSQTSMAARPIMEKFLTDRQLGQLDRISDDLTTLTGTKRTALQATKQTMEARAQDAAPAYKVAYQAGDKEVWSPELEKLSSSPTVKSAMQGAIRVWQDNAVADGYGAMNPTQVERGGLIKFGKSVPAFPNIQFWDYTKRILDDKIRSAVRAGQNQKARTLTALNNQLRDALDRQVPEFAIARQKWAGPSSYINALEEGGSILTRSESAEAMTNKFEALSDADKQGYREAAVSSLLNRLGSNPAKLADLTRELRSPEMRKKITAIMPTSEAKAAWNRRLDFEIKSSEIVGQGLKGSATARRQAEMLDADNMVGDLVLGVLKGSSIKGQMLAAIINKAKSVRSALRGKTDVEMAKILTGQKPSTEVKQPRRLGPSLLGTAIGADIGGLNSQSQ